MNVAVLGAGMMGAEIALSFAASGHPVTIKDTSLEIARKGKARLEDILDKAIKKGKLSADDKRQALDRITPTDKFEDLADAGLIIEAIVEDFEAKKNVLGAVEAVCGADCIITTNTSSIPITKLAACLGTKRRAKFAGAHFFSPAFVMKLVEIIPGLETGEETVTSLMDLCRKIGKTPIRVKDVTGFVVNRLLHAMWIEACRLLEEGVATPEDIDTGCKLGLGHPIGPFALMDLTANDLNLKVQEILFETYGERFRPVPILRQKVFADHFGRKTGRGWFEYDK